MTDDTAFRCVYDAFRVIPYPDRPQSEELQDWGSELLTLDTHVAGYATRVHSGNMSAREIPKLNELVREVGYLRSLLASIPARTDRDSRLKEEYELYVAMLDRMMKELVRLAAE